MENQFEKLVGTLVEAIGLILSSHSSLPVIVEKFVPQKATKNPAIYYNEAKDLLVDRSDAFTVPEGGKAYLRLYPDSTISPINSELEARSIVASGNLQPFGRVGGYGCDRNIFGAVVYESPENGNLYRFTQLFLNREIWGVEACVLNEDHIRKQLQQWGQGNFPSKYIANGYVEEYFVKALHNYIIFAQTHLRLPPPLRIEAGLVGIKDYSITVNSYNMAGRSLRDVIQWRGVMESYETPAWELLGPFFDRIWDNCGIQRTSQHQAALVKRFTG